MDQLKLAPSKLFVSSSLEIKDELEEKFERAFQYVQQQTNGLNDKELHELLSQLVCKEKHHEDISIGLLYIILTDSQLAPKTYRDLTLLSRDGLNLVNSSLTILVADKYIKLTDQARRQLLWLLRELVKNQVMNVDNTMWNCLRQASGGDVSQRNLLLVEGLLDIFIDYRQWLEKFPFLIGSVVYTYVRLIEDHTSNLFTNLKNKEVKFVISLIRERFIDIIPLGRDFVRLLQNVAKIPEFDQLWRDILFNPKMLCPTFNGIWHLLQIRTSRRYVQCRVTPEVERKLIFFASSVRFGSQKRYQDWFQDKYLATPESQSLRSDLIRFIINVIHPTNDMLCSDIIPRWAIIGWLLTSCTNPVALANAKLSLFYDWLFFDPNKDNIMNIEPGILVMYHSIRNHPFVSCTLLDFLCRIMKNFFPKSEDKIRIGVYNSLKQILEKQVIPNLQPLFESPKLDRELRNIIRDNFREFCSGVTTPMPPIMAQTDGMMINQSNAVRKNMVDEQRNNMNMDDNRTPPNFATYNQMSFINDGLRFGNVGDDLQESQDKINSLQKDETPIGEHDSEPMFSDEEDENNLDIRNEELTDDDDDLPLSKVRLKEKPAADKIELPTAITESLEIFLEKKTSSSFETFINDYRTLSISAIDTLQQDYIVANVYLVLKETLPSKIFADSKNDEKLLSESISYSLFTLFRLMYASEDKNKKPFQALINALYQRMPSIGYLILYFLKVYSKLQSRKNSSQNYNYKISVYKQLCDALDEKIDKCLVRDLSSLENESANIFLWIIPDIYRELKSNVINDSDIIRIILSCIDAKNLRDLIYSVTQGKLVIFKKDGLIDCIRDSLSYETFEQFCFWQLVQAHDVPIEYIQDIIPVLESSNHAEALTYLLLLIKNEEPTTELIRLLLSRETKSRGDPFVTSALRLLCANYEERLSEIIASLLTSKYPNSSPNKRKRPSKSSSTVNSAPSSDQLLTHLEHFRRSCRHGNGTGTGLYVQDSMQRALQQAHSHSSDSTKKQFNDLFSLAAEDETSSVGRRGTSGRGRKQPSNKKDINNTNNNTKKSSEPVNNLYTSDEESSEEDWSKPKQSKRRKKALSDSD